MIVGDMLWLTHCIASSPDEVSDVVYLLTSDQDVAGGRWTARYCDQLCVCLSVCVCVCVSVRLSVCLSRGRRQVDSAVL